MTDPRKDPSAPLLRHELSEWFSRVEKAGDHRIGTEQEKFGIVVDQGIAHPYDYPNHVRPILDGLIERFGWKVGKDRGSAGEIVALERDGASITLEPGGQLELSGAPLRNVHETCAEFTQHYEEIHAIAEPLGITFIACGFHPFATRDEVHWMPKDRYGIMREYLPTRGARALDMMIRTCTVQANFDYRDEKQCGERFRTVMGISPILTALFANSRYVEGKRSPIASERSETWEAVDPDRCGILPWLFEGPFSYDRYVDWVLSVPMFFIKRDGRYIRHHGPFSEYMKEGLVDEAGNKHHATWADWELHLSTVFPEVRLKPFIEVRGTDSVGSRTLCSMPALCKGLLYDDDAIAAAWELVSDLDVTQRMELWQEARRQATASPRIKKLSSELLAIARRSLERANVLDRQGRSEARFLTPLEAQVEAELDSSDFSVQNINGAPGRDAEGRLNLVRAFYFAGAKV